MISSLLRLLNQLLMRLGIILESRWREVPFVALGAPSTNRKKHLLRQVVVFQRDSVLVAFTHRNAGDGAGSPHADIDPLVAPPDRIQLLKFGEPLRDVWNQLQRLG